MYVACCPTYRRIWPLLDQGCLAHKRTLLRLLHDVLLIEREHAVALINHPCKGNIRKFGEYLVVIATTNVAVDTGKPTLFQVDSGCTCGRIWKLMFRVRCCCD